MDGRVCIVRQIGALMPEKSKSRRRSSEEEEIHTHLAIRVKDYNARVSASINHEIYNERASWTTEEDPVYSFTTNLAISGISTDPKERAGDIYELTIHGDDAPSRGHEIKLKDIQARDERGSLQYRTYRGKEVPVYDRPGSLGLLNKMRGEARWTGWLFTSTGFVRDMLVLLSHGRDVFLALHERRSGRTRWIQGLSLQTNDPADE